MSSSTNNVYNCKNENWLFNSADQWTLSPFSRYVNDNSDVIYVHWVGGVSLDLTRKANGVRPALFLKSDVVIAGGTGTESNPYTIE